MANSQAQEKEAFFSEAQRDVLIKLVEHGPVRESSIQSRAHRHALETFVVMGAAAHIVVKMEDGGVAATHFGRELYCALFAKQTVSEVIKMKGRTNQHDPIEGLDRSRRLTVVPARLSDLPSRVHRRE